MSIETLLFIRAILNIILFLIVLTGAVLCLASKHNGIYHAMGTTALVAACYIGVVIFISFVDVLLLPEVRRVMLMTWDVISALLVVAVLWLGWEMIRGDE